MGPRLRFTLLLLILLIAAVPLLATLHPPAKKSAKALLTAAAANNASANPVLKSSSQSGAAVLRAQILLDRAHFSPGEIDGRYGGITRGAVTAFNLAKKTNAGAQVNAATWKALNADAAPVIVDYTLTAADLAGPFTKMPAEMADKAK